MIHYLSFYEENNFLNNSNIAIMRPTKKDQGGYHETRNKNRKGT